MPTILRALSAAASPVPHALSLLALVITLAACGSDADPVERSEDEAADGDEDGGAEEDASRNENDDSDTDEGDDDDDEDDTASNGGRDGSTSSGSRDAGSGDTPSRDAASADAASDRDASSSDSDGSTSASGDVCERWNGARENLAEDTWNGNVETCDAGDMSDEARASALRLVNLYRSLSGLGPVEMTDEGNRLAQECALLMRANGTITHTPPPSWKCYTEEAADTAARSSLSTGPAVSTVDGYMVDPGNATTLGHRRWILSNRLASIGFGSAGRASCQYQPVARGTGGKAWVAWPPAGQVPLQAFGSRRASIDRTGWSLQSDTINLESAQVTVSSDGAELAVEVTPLGRNYGSTYALSIMPMGWASEAGKTYTVKVTGTSMPIEYEVEVVDCS